MTKTITLNQEDLKKMIAAYVSKEWFQGKPVSIDVNIQHGDRPGEPDTVSFSIMGPVE